MRNFQDTIERHKRSFISAFLISMTVPLSTFSIFLKSFDNYFFGWLAYKSLLSRSSVLLNYTTCSSNHFSASSFFPRFSWSRFLSILVFQGPGFLGSKFLRVQVFQAQEFLDPGFSGLRFFWVRVQVLSPGFRSSHSEDRNWTEMESKGRRTI